MKNRSKRCLFLFLVFATLAPNAMADGARFEFGYDANPPHIRPHHHHGHQSYRDHRHRQSVGGARAPTKRHGAAPRANGRSAYRYHSPKHNSSQPYSSGRYARKKQRADRRYRDGYGRGAHGRTVQCERFKDVSPRRFGRRKITGGVICTTASGHRYVLPGSEYTIGYH